MIVYNITFHIDKEILPQCIDYLKDKFIPQASSSGFLMSPCLRRVMYTPENEGESYAVQFHVKNHDSLSYWLDKEGRIIHQQLIDTFGDKVAGFTTLLEEIELG